MKKHVRQFATVFGLSALLGTAALVAQTHQAAANVPFGFHVKDTVFPAGRYNVAQEANGILKVGSASTGKTILVMTGGKHSTNRTDPRLTFNRYGNEYFLTEVVLPQLSMSMKIPPTAREKEYATSRETASLVSVSLAGE